jgi:ribosomal protein S18 acetylase RimI-like enzyme
VGGTCARLEPCPDAAAASPSADSYDLYISQLAVLSAYRRYGLATALLDNTLEAAQRVVQRLPTASPGGSRLRCVYAHVWEQNEDALEWYVSRGFVLEEIVQGYYRRLKPGGARVVRRVL